LYKGVILLISGIRAASDLFPPVLFNTFNEYTANLLSVENRNKTLKDELTAWLKIVNWDEFIAYFKSFDLKSVFCIL